MARIHPRIILERPFFNTVSCSVATFHYDSLGRLDRQGLPDGTSITTALNTKGEVESSAYPSGATVAYEYDDVGRLRRAETADDARDLSYDVAGRLTRAANSAAELTFGYDPVGGVATTSTQRNLGQPGQPAYSTTSEWDVTFTRLQAKTYPSGRRVGYDDAGRVTSIANGDGGPAFGLDYDARGLLERMTSPDGSVTEYDRDEVGRTLAQRTFAGGSPASERLRVEYGWSATGDKTFEKTSWATGPGAGTSRADVYDHDDGGQLVAVRYGVEADATAGAVGPANRPGAPSYEDSGSSFTVEEAWAYDPMGNREWMTLRTETGAGVTSSTTAYAADVMNRYLLRTESSVVGFAELMS